MSSRFLDGVDLRTADSPNNAALVSIREPNTELRPGSLYGDGIYVDLQWHYHDMHKLLYAFEGAIEVESTLGRNLVPRQLAAWIPAGVPHCSSIHGIRWVSVFFPTDMLEDSAGRVRTVTVSGLMREMMREATRWHINGPSCAIRGPYFQTMAGLCQEWIKCEANLFLPTSDDARVKRALDYTSQHMDAKLSDACAHAGLSIRTLRRHLKAETGMTWEDYRYRARLLRAISLLSETDMPVSEIAARCGFESPSAFAKAFRLAMGEVPRSYRNRTRGHALED